MATTPAVNLDVNLVKGGSATYRDAVEKAYAGRLAEGDSLAASYKHSTWTGSEQTHHILASNVVNDDKLVQFFGDLRAATIDAPGGAYAFDINNPSNLVNLPTTSSVRQTGVGVTAALHSGSHLAYDDFTSKVLYSIEDEYRLGLDRLGQPGYPPKTDAGRQALALKAAAQVEDFKDGLRSGLFGKATSDIKYFLNQSDDILTTRFAASGYGAMSPDQQRAFLKQNVYNANPDTLKSKGDVLRQQMSTGETNTRLLTDEAMQRYVNDPSKPSLNGVPHDKWVAEQERIAADIRNKSPSLTAEQAKSQALGQLRDNADGIVAARQIQADPDTAAKVLGKLDTPADVSRLRKTFDFVKRIASHPAAKVAGKALGAIGLVLGAVDANAAYQRGDAEEAKRIMSNAVAEAISNFAADIAIGAAVGTGVLALGVAAIPATIIGVGAGLLGGYLSSEASERAMNYARQALADRGIDLGIGTPAPPRNPNIFNLDVNPGFGATHADVGLGNATTGQGLVIAGPTYSGAFNKDYVDENGLDHAAPSDQATAGIRAGNLNGSTVLNQVNHVRQQWRDGDSSSPELPSLATQTSTSSVATTATAANAVTEQTAAAVPIKATSALSWKEKDENGQMVTKYLSGTFVKDGGSGKITGFYSADGETYIKFNPADAYVDSNDGKLTWNSWQIIDLTGSSRSLSQMSKAEQTSYTDPLALDGSNDGVQFNLGLVNFDLNADGTVEPVRWTSPADPLLVLDVNGDGRIDNGTELVSLIDGGKPLNLLSMDNASQGGNSDKKLSSADAQFNRLRLWTDRNQDGYASTQELQSLSGLGIASLDLDPAHIQTDSTTGSLGVNGVIASYANGDKRTLWDVTLAQSAMTPATAVSFYAQNVNKVSGSGETALLAMSNSGVQIQLQGSGATQAIGGDGQDTLLGSNGGDWLIGGKGADQFQGGDGADLLVIDAEDRQIDGGAGIDIVVIADEAATMLNLAKSQVEVVYGGYGKDVLLGGGSDNYFIDGGAGDDFIAGGTNDDVLAGGDGQDVLCGDIGDDLIRGGRDADILLGGDGNDVIDGGEGNDTLHGGIGNDIVKTSAGSDEVDGGDGTDLLELHGGLEDYTFAKTTEGWSITDNKNVDGGNVAAGAVSNRDGVQRVKNVERISFKRGMGTGILDLGTDAPIPVNDVVRKGAASGSVTINSTELLSNDVNFQRLASPQITINWVGEATGGTVALSADRQQITFTRQSGYSGPVSFSYKVSDAQGHSAPTMQDVLNPSVTATMKGRATIVPADSPIDPLYAKEWYLSSINAAAAWGDGYTGKGVKVLVLEPAGPYAVGEEVADLSNAEFASRRSDRFQDTTNHSAHATAVAGVIAAGKNGQGSVGVAYDATIDSVSLPVPQATNWLASERKKLEALKEYDVVNNSWTPSNPWNVSTAYSGAALETSAIQSSIYQAATQGRNGLGTVMVFAAGNNRSKGYDAGLSAPSANPYTITVGGISRLGDIGTDIGDNKPFSNRGADILVSAPASNITTINTIAFTADGEQIGTASQELEGTSLATPIVSGIAALMLQANPNLSYRDVQTILALTARKDLAAGSAPSTQGSMNPSTATLGRSSTVVPVYKYQGWQTNADTSWNGVGMHFSPDFGFGNVDAAAAVRMAESWRTSGAAAPLSAYGSLSPKANNPLTTVKYFQVTLGDDVNIEQVMLHLGFDNANWSNLRVTLTSPSGTTSVLLDRPGWQDGQTHLSNPDGQAHFEQTLMSTNFRGESSKGVWTLAVLDVTGATVLANASSTLEALGSSATAPKRYVLTDEYAGGWSIRPSASIASELNGSALSSAMSVDLSGQTVNTVAGKSLTLAAGITRLLGGEADDTLTGSAKDDTILGGHGNDVIHGGGGADRLDGGAGNDILYGDVGQDLLIAGQGQDVLWGNDGPDIFLIDGKLGSITTIKDFSTAAGGDTLRIQTHDRLGWSNVQQVVGSDGLTLRFTADDGNPSTILLAGIKSALTRAQLVTMSSSDDIPKDPLSAAYVAGNSIYVSPVATITEHAPTKIDTIQYDNIETVRFTPGKIDVSNPNYQFFHYLEASAHTTPGKQIVVLTGSPDTGGFILGPEVLSAHWNGLYRGPNNDTVLGFLSEDVYSNGGAPTYSIDNLHWVQGTDEGEQLIAGPTPSTPDHISPDAWSLAIAQLGPRQINGKGGDDELTGDATAEVLDGGADSDVLTGGAGNDTLKGGTGADTFNFSAGDGQDTIVDVEGIDTLRFKGVSQTNLNQTVSLRSDTSSSFTVSTKLQYSTTDSVSLNAVFSEDALVLADLTQYKTQFDTTSQTKVLNGSTLTETADVLVQERLKSTTINALGGGDIVFSLKQNHMSIDGGSGNDTLYALEGQNVIQGGADNDRIDITAASVSVGKDTLVGGQGDDTIHAGSHGAVLYGDDLASSDSLAGNDQLYGGMGDDLAYGGAGDDMLEADSGKDTLWGGIGNDTLSGGFDDDTLNGDNGNDKLNGGDGNDSLNGGKGNDILIAGNGLMDTLYGGDDNDVLAGGVGADFLSGDAGNDTLTGAEGNDTLNGGTGDDFFDTGSGTDLIQLDLNSGADFADRLTGTDTVRISGISSSTALNVSLINNGQYIKLSWGSSNSLTLSNYSLDLKIALDSNINTTLRTVLNEHGLKPDGSFSFIGNYDTQLQGDTNWLGTLTGSNGSDQLYGGPDANTGNPNASAAYWYVVGSRGEDSLASGLSGAILDGGSGNDVYRGSNGVLILRTTQYGGEDRLVMPEGVTSNMLLFSRIPNPLDAAATAVQDASWGGTGFPYYAAPGTNLERLLMSRNISNQTQLPDISVYLGLAQDHDTPYLPRIDTLRIQTIDGKSTIDVPGYFSGGAYRNNISSITFATEFDAQGNSKTYDLDGLIRAQSYSRSQLFKPVYANPEGKPSIYVQLDQDYKISPDADFAMMVGSESGERFAGRVKKYEYSRIGNHYSSTSSIISVADYQLFISDIGKSIRDAVGDSNDYYEQFVFASLPDVLLAFGGNDTIDGGGTFEEEIIGSQYGGGHYAYADQIGKLNATYPNPPEYQPGEVWADTVNGGSGDDTYIYHKGYGYLDIVALNGQPAAGADGFDTLDLRDFNRSDVQVIRESVDGSMTLRVAGGMKSGGQSIITIQGGADGCAQVDQILFGDGAVALKDLLDTPMNKFAAPPQNLPVPVDPYLALKTGLPSASTREGSPIKDFILVPNNGIAQGNEGGDVYIIDGNAATFAVVMVDQADAIRFSGAGQVALGQLASKYALPELRGAGGLYGGKDINQWLQAGVVPSSPIPSSYGYTYVPLSTLTYSPAGRTIEFGKLLPLEKGGGYGLENWLPLGPDNDIATDVLITWKTKSADNVITERHAVFVGYGDAWYGMRNSRYIDGIVPTFKELTGTEGDDFLPDLSGASTSFYALAGNDTVTGVSFADELHGGAGNDSLDGVGANDKLYGDDGNDTLIGGVGADTLWGGRGIDSLIGGPDNDLYYIDQGDVIVENQDSGIDEIRGELDIDLNTVYLNVENATLQGKTAHRVIGSNASNQLTGNGAGSTLEGLNGDDTYVLTASADTVIEAFNAGHDLVLASMDVSRLTANVEDLTSKGIGLTLIGNDSDNVITGDAGSNYLDGASGQNTLIGGAGDDTYLVWDNAHDAITEQAGGGAQDIVWVKQSYVLSQTGNDLEVMKAYSSNAVNMTGNALANLLVGNDGNDTLNGGGGNDSIYGGAGKDALTANAAGYVILSGGAGQDTYTVDLAQALTAEIRTPEHDGDTLVLGGIKDKSVLHYQRVSGGEGGIASWQAGASTRVRITADGVAGALVLDIFDAYGDDAESFSLIKAGASVLSFDEIKNALAPVATSGNDSLFGFASDDFFDGGAGTDWIVGNGGADFLYGNTGNDTLESGGGLSTLVGGAGQDIYIADLARAGATQIIAPEKDGDVLYIRGVDDASVLTYQRVEATVDPDGKVISWQTAPGNQVMISAPGLPGQVVVKAFNANGTNTASGEMPTIMVGSTQVTFAIIQAALAPTSTSSNDTLFGFVGNETLSGGDGNDWIDGHGGVDQLDGGDGSDIISGGGMLIGGLGNDTLSVSVTGSGSSQLFGGDGDDVLSTWIGAAGPSSPGSSLVGGHGNDTIYMSFNDTAIHVVGDGVDLFSASASNTIQLQGFKLSDLQWGRQKDTNNLTIANANSLDNDRITITGFYSDISRVKIQVLNEAGTGYVTLSDATIDGLLKTGSDLDNYLLGTSGIDNLDGKRGNDYIDGNSGNDSLAGGDGNDTIFGGVGRDSLYGGAGNDELMDVDAGNYFDGGDGSDSIEGGLGNDSMLGGAGNDVLYGGGGTDTLNGGTGNDVYSIFTFPSTVTSVEDFDSAVGNVDTIALSVDPYSVLFAQSGNDLLVTHLGAAGSLSIKNWFAGAANHVELFTTYGVSTLNSERMYTGQLSDVNVQGLITAMATFKPAQGQLEVTDTQLRSAITQAWGVQVA